MILSRVVRAASRALAICIVTTALAPVAAVAADRPLTLPQAQRLAVERSRLLSAQDSAAAAAREMAVVAEQLPDPVASISINNVPVSGADAFSLSRDFMTMRSIGVMQELIRPDKRRARAARFEREADKAIAEKAAVVVITERDTALAWLERYYAEGQAAVVAEQARQARLELDAAETAYRSGRGGLAEILTARSALVSLDDRASELRRRVAAAKIALARYVGDTADAPLGARPAIDALRLDRHSLDAELDDHPVIAALGRREELAAADVHLAQANRKADWSVQVMYSQRGSAFPDMVSLGVSVPLQWDRPKRQDRELAARLAMLDQVRAEREDGVRAHRAEVHAMLVEWENGKERSARYDAELLPLATQRTEATLAAYRGAKATLTDVLLARRNEIDVRMQALQLEGETARAWAQLNFLTSVRQSSPVADALQKDAQ
jgi:outer membrane protein TolC